MALTKIDDRGLKTPIDLLDNEKIRLGTGNDLDIYHDGSNSFTINNTGNYLIKSSADVFIRTATNEDAIHCNSNAGVEIYYDEAKKFETYTSGVEVIGTLWLRTASGKIQLNDDIKLICGNGDDLQIYHDGSDSYINDTGTGRLMLLSNQFQVNSADNSEIQIRAYEDGAVELFYDGTKKFNTGSAGVEVQGNLWVGDSSEIQLGENGDLKLYHDGTDSFIHNQGANAGNFYIRGAGADVDKWVIIQAKSGENSIVCKRDAEVILSYDGVNKFETTSDGGTLSGALTVTNEINLFNGTTNASRYIDAGLGDDNSLVFRGCSGGDANHETLAQFQRNGAVELYHDNVKVIRTTSSGFNIGTHTGGQCLNQFNSGWSEFADDTDSGNIAVNTNVFLFVSAQKSAGPTTNYPTAIYHITYTGDITRLSQSADVFSENTDTDGRICVYKQANGQFRVKNRTGVNNKIGITVLHAQGV